MDFIPETVNINDLFKKMQSKKSHLAMVVDEYGQISGLIAMEDILEDLSEISRMSTMRKKTTSEKMMTRHL